MSVAYEAPVPELMFLLQHVTGLKRLGKLSRFEDCTPELAEAVLQEASKFAKEVIWPLNQSSEAQPPVLSHGNVNTSPGYREAYDKFVEAGWNGLACPTEHGGQGLCEALASAVSEMWQSASMSFGLCPMLTAGAIHAIEMHASHELKQRFLPKLVSGQWTGTMNLTEPQAGSDLAAITTKATPEDNHYLIKGSKIFITYGEHDLAENIIHLVLARLPDAPAGVKGISLFIVPKYLVGEDGSLGPRNDVTCTALEHKVGIHGSPTAAMKYGEKNGAIGYLVGQPHQGLAYMFTMMNHARLQVGLQGLAVSEASFQQARAYAHERIQGKPLLCSDGKGPIAYHPDVARMLISMQSRILAMRALVLEAATELDLASQEQKDSAAVSQARVDLLIPIVKGWCTEQAQEITSMGVQIHGGMGYIEETGIGRLWRDARITPIYEGTTAIQANDFIGRKILRDNGKAISDLIKDMEDIAAILRKSQNVRLQQLGNQLYQGINALNSAVQWCLLNAKDNLPSVYFASVPLLMLAGYVTGGWMVARIALACQETASELSADFLDKQTRLALAYGSLVLLPSLGLLNVVEQANQLCALSAHP